MPWLQFLLLLAAVYLLVKGIQGIRDFIIWYREGQAFAAERKRLQALRRQQHSEGIHMPTLKERPADASKPPVRQAKSPKNNGGVAEI